MATLIGTTLGQYEITSLLGKGGMASVYRARQKSMGRDVAIKVMKPDLAETAEFVARFEREARTIASLSHAHILKVFDYGQHEDLVYLVMELLSGGSLSDRICQGALNVETTTQVIDQISSALEYAHLKGIIHRDLKPQNVLLDETGSAHLTDFGIAKILSETALTQSGVAMGTPTYMSPEQWRGQSLDARADIYALGIMLFEMLTGRAPFSGDTAYSMMHKHITEPPPSVCSGRPDLSQDVDGVIQKALAKDRDQRFSSAGQLASAFKAAATSETLAGTVPGATLVETSPGTVKAAVPATRAGEPTVATRRKITPLLVGGVLGLAVLALVGSLLVTSAGPRQPTAMPTATSVAAVTANNQWKPVVQTFAGVEMALVPPGCFLMGSTDTQVESAVQQAVKDGWKVVDAHQWISVEKPQNKVCFTQAFWIDKTEVTQAQFDALRGSAAKAPAFKGDSRPVEQITWFEARDFCEKRGAELPKEAEWEYVARGPDSLIYPWGNTFDEAKTVWLRGDRGTAAVGSRPDGVSWVGALDLSGNVWEWTNNELTSYPYDAQDGREHPGTRDTRRVVRGGSWADVVQPVMNTTFRSGAFFPSDSSHYLGFRCARPFEVPIEAATPAR